jgi:hypothetical protein
MCVCVCVGGRGGTDAESDAVGLITDSTNSPFTTIILPYQRLNSPDAKFTWNRYSFDEGLASRVPYESAARTLAQTRRSYEGYTVRQGG